MNIRVINLSYGTNSTQPYTVDPLAYAVEQAENAGIVVVAAAGNSGYKRGASAQGLADPAYDPEIVAVGAADTMGTATLSATRSRRSRQAQRAAAAAAAGRICLLRARTCRVSASPAPPSTRPIRTPLWATTTSGAAAPPRRQLSSRARSLTLLQRYPGLTPDQVKEMLITSCDKLHSMNWKQGGCGELDMTKLLSAPEAPGLTAKQYSSLGSEGALERQRLARGVAWKRPPLDGRRGAQRRAGHLRRCPSTRRLCGTGSRGPQLVGRNMERLVVVGELVERHSWSGSSWRAAGAEAVERLELERLVLVGQFLEQARPGREARGAEARGAARAGAVRAGRARPWLGASWG